MSKPTHYRYAAAHGFTLLEVLIALAIFAVLGVIANISLDVIFKNKATLDQHYNALSELQMATVIMTRDLEQLIDRPIITANGRQQLRAISGDETQIHFTRGGYVNPLAQQTRSHLQRVAYRFTDRQWVRQSWPELDRAPKSEPITTTLLSQVNNITINYFDDNLRRYNSWPPNVQFNPNNQAVTLGHRKELFPKAIEIKLTTAQWGDILLTINVTAKSLYAKTKTDN